MIGLQTVSMLHVEVGDWVCYECDGERSHGMVVDVDKFSAWLDEHGHMLDIHHVGPLCHHHKDVW